MNSKTWKTGAGVLGLVLVAACTTTGARMGTTRGDDAPVNFHWTVDDFVFGTMIATLPNGQSFDGKFVQVTNDTPVDALAPLWVGWGRGPDWPFWGAEAAPDFVKHYAGRVLANLQGPRGERMRCAFSLIEPTSGMAGGGAGQCEMPTGQTVEATFPAA